MVRLPPAPASRSFLAELLPLPAPGAARAGCDQGKQPNRRKATSARSAERMAFAELRSLLETLRRYFKTNSELAFDEAALKDLFSDVSRKICGKQRESFTDRRDPSLRTFRRMKCVVHCS